MESQENHSSAAPVPPSTPGAPHWLLSDVHRLAASRAEHCLALVLTASKGHPHSSADCVGWSECQGMRLSSSLIVCKLVFCIQSDSVIRSTPWASALPANPPWKSPWEPQIQKLCLVPPPWVTSLFFRGHRQRFWFSPHNPLTCFMLRANSLALWQEFPSAACGGTCTYGTQIPPTPPGLCRQRLTAADSTIL